MKLTLISNPSTNADEIYNTVAQNCNFYIDSNGEAFMVCYDRGTYTLVYLSYADLAKRFINLLVFQHYNCTVRNSDIQTAYDTICALVTACSKKVAVYTRVGRIGNNVYYDLAGPSGDIVEITDSKVSVVKKSSVKGLFFSQDKAMLEQVEPIVGDYCLLDFINENFNVCENQRLLFAVYICAAFVPGISHPILITEGEKGSGKTITNKRLSRIINPVAKDVFVLPKKENDLITSLSNNHFCAFDNVGTLSADYCNVLCQASTGGALTKRKLYSDNTEICINIKRLVSLNGVNMKISQSDLLDRAIILKLNRIENSKRLPDEELEARFNERLPYALGNIFKIISKMLKIFPNIQLKEYKRMSDFSRYGYAIAEAIHEGWGEKFLEDYGDNIKLATETVVEENPLLSALWSFIDKKEYWRGTASELLATLQNSYRQLNNTKILPASFPSNAISLSRALGTHEHEMEVLGISYESGRSKDRYIELRKIGTNPPPESTNLTNSTTEKSNGYRKVDSLLTDD